MKISTHYLIAPIVGSQKKGVVLILALLLSTAHCFTASAQKVPPLPLVYSFSTGTGVLTISGTASGIDAYSIKPERVDEALSGSPRSAIKSVSIHATGITTVKVAAFANCSALTAIALPEGIVTVEAQAFMNCSALATLTLPASVRSIGIQAFFGCALVGTLALPASLEGIGDAAFANNSGLTGTLVLPSKLMSIGNGAFARCSGLTGTLSLPVSVATLGLSVFGECSGITKVDLSATTLTAIGSGTFAMCSSLTEISLPASLTSIGDGAFSGCSKLATLALPVKVATIGNDAFKGCTGLTGTLALPESLTTIGEAAFNGCSTLVTLILPASVAEIGATAFYGCSLLTSINALSTTPPALGSEAFANGPASGRTLYVPNATVEGSFGTDADNYWGADKVDYSKDAGLVYTFIKESGVLAISGRANATDYTITKAKIDAAIAGSKRSDIKSVSITATGDITAIGDNAFKDCSTLNAFTIPPTVTAIGKEAFMKCSKLAAITLPAPLESIGEAAFALCGSLAGSLTLPSGLKSIGESAFNSCEKISGALVFPASMETIGETAFAYCKLITSIDLSKTEFTTISSETFVSCEGVSSLSLPTSLASIGRSAFASNDKVEEIDLSLCNELTTIEQNAFNSCMSMTKLTLPTSVATIGANAFSFCQQLATIDVHCTVEPIIGDNAFAEGSGGRTLNALNATEGFGTDTDNKWGASKVNYKQAAGLVYTFIKESGVLTISGTATDVTVTKDGIDAALSSAGAGRTAITSVVFTATGITTIGDKAFKNCKALTTFTIPTSVATLGEEAFYGCAFESVDLSATALTTLPIAAFAYCVSLATITLPADITFIGDAAFSSTGLTVLDLSKYTSLTTLDVRAFSVCVNLTTLTLPASVASIGDSAFSGCSILSTITTLGTTEPAKMNESTFAGGPAIRVLNVPNATSGFGTDKQNNWGATTINYKVVPGLTFSFDFNTKKLIIGGSATKDDFTVTEKAINDALKSVDARPYVQSVDFTATGITAIGDKAFNEFRVLPTIILPESITAIGANAFNKCYALATITALSTTEPSIGDKAFINGPDARTLNVPNATEGFGESGKDKNKWRATTINYKTVTGLTYDSETNVLTLADGVTTINNVTNSGGQLTIGNNNNFTGALDLDGPVKDKDGKKYTITIIMNDAFSIAGTEKQGITALTLPATIEVIGNRAFSSNKKIAGILVLPAPLKSIGKEAFKGCEGITGIDFTEVTALKTIEVGVFLGCKGIAGIITLPASVEAIGGEAFSNCAALDSLSLPASVATIGASAFAGCENLTSITTLSTTQPSIGNAAFGNGPATGRTLNVPNATEGFGTDTDNQWGAHKIKYKNPAGLTDSFDSAAARIIGAQGSVILAGFAPGTIYTVYALASSVVATGTIDSDHTAVALPAGIYIVKADDQAIKVVVALNLSAQ